MAATQVLGVGTMALIAQASGRKDQADANLIFNQSLLLALIAGIVTLLGGYALIGPYMGSVGADERTVAAGSEYLRWFFPGLALQFALIAMGSALRGTGINKPALIVQMLTVVLNAILAPILIAGWLTHVPLGIAGAGLATSISVGVRRDPDGTLFPPARKVRRLRQRSFSPRVLRCGSASCALACRRAASSR